MANKMIVLTAIALGLASCGGSEPDCASSGATSLVAQIAKENNAFLQMFLLRKAMGPHDATDGGLLEAQQEFKDGATYKIAAIRMKAKDATTKAVTCEADLILEMPHLERLFIIPGMPLSEKKPITYQIEKTSDGQLYATVSGLR